MEKKQNRSVVAGTVIFPETDDELSHAYLIEGDAESASSVAEALIRRILVDLGGGSLQRLEAGVQTDLVRVEEEKIPVEQIRQLTSDLYRRPLEGKYRIFYLKHADAMREEAQNALLKSLEEPPLYLVWILLTENHARLLPTIRSRCRFIRAGRTMDACADGAEPLLSSEAVGRLRRMVQEGLAGRGAMVFDRADPFSEYKSAKKETIVALRQILRDMLEWKAGLIADRSVEVPPGVSMGMLAHAVSQVEMLRAGMDVNLNFQMSLESFFLHLGKPTEE